jgi:anti-sigma regulatory factor (Ser/Thr protein kinase)
MRMVMRRAEPALVPRPLPLGLPLLLAILLTMLVDRTFGLTSLAVVPQQGFAGGVPADAPTTLLADLVAVLVVVVVLLGMELSGRPRRRRAMHTVLVLASLVGLQLGAAAVTAATRVTVPTDLYLARALLLAATTSAVLHLLTALAEHRRATHELRRATAAAEALAEAGRVGLQELREDVAARIREVLRDALGALEAGATSGSAARLRSLADDVVRPLSHRLAAASVPSPTAAGVVAAARWRDTLRTLLRTPVIAPRILALLATSLAFLRSLVTDQQRVRDLSPAIPADAEGVGVALTVDVLPLLVVLGELALIIVVTRWGAAWLAAHLEPTRHLRRPAAAWGLTSIGIAAIAVLIVVGPVLADRLVGFTTGPVDVRALQLAFVATFVPLLATTVGVSLVAAVAGDRAALEADLDRQRAAATRLAARVQAVLGHEQRRLARSLHADVQAAINAAGLMLERADRQGGVTPEIIDDAAARIATSVERFVTDGTSPLPVAARLEEVRRLWAGVCTVSVELDEEVGARLDSDAVTRELVVDLVTEACANAVVHGDAARVTVRLAMAAEEEEVALEVRDDGTRRRLPTDLASERTVPAPVGGLGTDVLRASCTRFTLDLGAHGGHLQARLPMG